MNASSSIALVVCPACACHMRSTESACPFCAAPQSRRAASGSGRGASRWLGVGTAVAALSCSSGSTSPASDASKATGATDAPTMIADGGSIPCGDASCSAASQVCVTTDGVTSACESASCNAAMSPPDGSFVGNLLCQCYVPDASASCSCYESDGGVVSCISHTCYGSPPPRDRLLVA